MPPTFPIASLNRYTPNFSGVTQKLTWCQQFGLQILPKWGDADIFLLKMAVFRCLGDNGIVPWFVGIVGLCLGSWGLCSSQPPSSGGLPAHSHPPPPLPRRLSQPPEALRSPQRPSANHQPPAHRPQAPEIRPPIFSYPSTPRKARRTKWEFGFFDIFASHPRPWWPGLSWSHNFVIWWPLRSPNRLLAKKEYDTAKA